MPHGVLPPAAGDAWYLAKPPAAGKGQSAPDRSTWEALGGLIGEGREHYIFFCCMDVHKGRSNM